MKFQLLLLGAIAARTVGAVSRAASVPTASISPHRSFLESPSQQASSPPPVVSLATPSTTPATTDVSTTTITVQPAVEAAAIPDLSNLPAACQTAVQLVAAAHRERPLTKSVIAAAIAECFAQLPPSVQPSTKTVASGQDSGDD